MLLLKVSIGGRCRKKLHAGRDFFLKFMSRLLILIIIFFPSYSHKVFRACSAAACSHLLRFIAATSCVSSRPTRFSCKRSEVRCRHTREELCGHVSCCPIWMKSFYSLKLPYSTKITSPMISDFIKKIKGRSCFRQGHPSCSNIAHYVALFLFFFKRP